MEERSLIFRHDDETHRYHRVRLVRDLIEIAAIVVAGFWAFYVFAYENRIKPSFTNPELVFSVTMTKVGVHHGMVAVQINNEVKNVGQVRVHLLGFALWVSGRRVIATAGSAKALAQDSTLTLASPFYKKARRVSVFGYGYVTSLGDPKTRADLVLDPGASTASQDVFFVPQRQFDLLEAYLLVRYTKYERVVPTRLELGPNGLPVFIGDHTDNLDYDNFISSVVL
jgi:hypothetical protein